MANDSRIIKTGLFGKKNKDILDSVIGQWADGIWENNPQMAKYWEFANVAMPNGEVVLKIDLDRTNGHHWNGFYGLPDDKVKEIFGRYVKAIVKEELSDGLEGDWKRDCTSECDYLTRSDDEPVTVKDAYYAYEVLKGRNVNKHPEYSEAFYAQKDDKDYQIEIELEDGPNAEDPEKLTVVVDGKKETVDVPKDGTEDHYRKAIDAGLKKLGYKMMEGKIPEATAIVPKFVQINTQGDFDKYIKPALGKGSDAYGLDNIKGMWWELSEEDKISSSAKTMREIRDGVNKRPRIIFISGAGNERGITDMSLTEYAREMGMTTKDYLDGVKPFETKKCESGGWAGWEDVTDLEPTIEKIEQLAYELRSCVRGAYTRCNTWAELSEYIKNLANDLEAAGDNASYMEEDDESKQK